MMSGSEQRLVRIVVNGQDREVPAGETVTGLLRSLGLEPSRVAVELNRRIVKQPEWPRTGLPEGSRLEIVQFVGGG